MGKLKLECFDKKIKTRKIAKAVYQTLCQEDNLKAELVFASSEKIHALNKDTRGVDSVTDVLSYPILENQRGEIIKRENHRTELDGRYVFIGSIVLCEDKIIEQAKELGHSVEKEMTYLIIHGLMHLFGYDHMTEEDKRQMRAVEKLALKRLGVEE